MCLSGWAHGVSQEAGSPTQEGVLTSLVMLAILSTPS